MNSKKKLLITTTGFYNTGSSAITHLLSELDGVDNKAGVYEVRLLYDPDCVSDLEYNLIENPHRYNTSNALIRFKEHIDFNSRKLTNHHYESLCEGKFREISYDYINDLVDFKYLGASHIDVYNRGSLFWIINRVYKKIVYSIFGFTPPKYVPGTLMTPQQQYAGTCDRKKFIEATHKYMEKVLSYMNKSNSEVLMIDQIFPPTNIKRYTEYIPDNYNVKTFIVDRDPRDLYLICKYLENTRVIPCQSPEIFCDWFLWTRHQSLKQPDSDCFLRINFEDLIYRYEETRAKVIKFCGLENYSCSKKLQIFKPNLSINNTQVWYRYEGCEKEVEYIAARLKDFCYDYDSFDMKPDFKHGKMFEC